jgi:hypothetical protein
MEPDKVEDPFLSELIGLDPASTSKGKSVLLSSMPSEDIFNPEEQEEEEVEEDLLTMMDWTEMDNLPTMSLMATTSRTWSPSPRPMTSKLWDHFPESLMEIEPKLRPPSLNSSDTSCSTKESQYLNLLFNKLH